MNAIEICIYERVGEKGCLAPTFPHIFLLFLPPLPSMVFPLYSRIYYGIVEHAVNKHKLYAKLAV